MLKNLKSHWFLVLFSLPFAGVSLGFLFLSILPSLNEWQAMKSWPQTEAYLLSATLHEHRGDDSTTYEAQARYRYEYSGITYESERVAIMGGADNIGDFQRHLGRELTRAHLAQQPVMAWVNPDNPTDAVLSRDMRWELLGFKMIFVVVFGIVGIGLLCWALLSKSSVIEHPESASKPWLARREWAQARVPCSARGGLWLAWIFAILWNAISSFLWFVIPAEVAKGNYMILIAALFPLVGLGLLWWAISVTLEWRRFGELYLDLDPYPGAIGGQVGGTLELSLPYDRTNAFPLSLSCVHSYMSGSGKNRSRKESVTWQAQGYAYAESSAGGTRLNFRFDVPEGLPSSEAPADSYYVWRLVINADLPGVDLHRQFELPVFPTAERSRYQREDSAAHPLALEQRDALIESVLDLRQVHGGVELYYPMWRNAGMKLGWMLFGLIFGGAGIGMWYTDAPRFMAIIFTGIGLLACVFCLYGLLNSLRIRLDQQGLWTQRRLLGMIVHKQHYPRAQIKHLQLHKSYSAQSGSEYTEVFALKALAADGKKITVGESLKGRATAVQALDAISLLSGYPAVTDAAKSN